MAELTDILYEIEVLERDLLANTDRSQAASDALRNIHNSSPWYTARYSAGYSLYSHGLKSHALAIEVLDDFIPDWINELRPRLAAVTSVQAEGGLFYDLVYQKARIDAVKDAGGLLRLNRNGVAEAFLKSVYNGEYDYLLNEGKENVDTNGKTIKSGLDSSVRAAAGRELGYSMLRINAHEHPIKTVVAGIIAAAGAVCATYCIYDIYQSPKDAFDRIADFLSHLNNS